MGPIEAFIKAAKAQTVVGPDGKVVSDDLTKFRYFRSLVDEASRANYDRTVLHWYVSENSAPDAGMILCDMLDGQRFDVRDAKRISANDLESLIPSDDRDLLLTCYDLVGVDGSIDISIDRSGQDRIDIHDSYRYESKASIETGDFTRRSVRVLIVDGFIENVSEIHHMLQRCSEDKTTVLLFARGFSPDVLNTLSVNYARRTLDVIPFSVPLDETRVNDLFDLGLITGGEVISSEKGQLISTTKYEQLAYVSYVKFSSNENLLVMKNDSSAVQVRAHLKSLRERLETADQFNSENLAKRIRRLTSLVCIVSLKEGFEFERRSRELRRSSRLIDHYSKFGKVDLTDGRCFPRSSFEVALKHYEDIVEQNRTSVILRF